MALIHKPPKIYTVFIKNLWYFFGVFRHIKPTLWAFYTPEITYEFLVFTGAKVSNIVDLTVLRLAFFMGYE